MDLTLLGSLTLSTPSTKCARARSASTGPGSGIVRWNEPKKRSERWNPCPLLRRWSFFSPCIVSELS